MPEYVPTLDEVGVPVSNPVDPSKRAHPGRFRIRNDRRFPSGSEAEGRKEYSCPTAALVGGVPEIVGGLARFRLNQPAWLGAATATASKKKTAARAKANRRIDRGEKVFPCMTRHSPGSPAIRLCRGPEVLRPRLTTGLPLNELRRDLVPSLNEGQRGIAGAQRGSQNWHRFAAFRYVGQPMNSVKFSDSRCVSFTKPRARRA